MTVDWPNNNIDLVAGMVYPIKKINYYKPVRTGNIVCTTDMVNRGKSIANLESAIYVDNMIVAKANGNFSIFTPSNIKVDALARITGQAP